jgi:hypothetical protein
LKRKLPERIILREVSLCTSIFFSKLANELQNINYQLTTNNKKAPIIKLRL